MVVYRMVPFVKMQPTVLSKWMYHIVYKLYLHKVHGKTTTTKKNNPDSDWSVWFQSWLHRLLAVTWGKCLQFSVSGPLHLLFFLLGTPFLKTTTALAPWLSGLCSNESFPGRAS